MATEYKSHWMKQMVWSLLLFIYFLPRNPAQSCVLENTLLLLQMAKATVRQAL